MSAPYGYVRALEAEGRHPHDVGQWGVTSMRLQYLEGLPLSFDDYLVGTKKDGTFEPTPAGLHRAFVKYRERFYRRVRTSEEASAVLKRRGVDGLTKVCLPLFRSWITPPDGVIPMPSPGDQAAPDTHAVRLLDTLRLDGTNVSGEANARHFLFENSWGEKWGKKGRALLPFAYYDTYAFEQWSEYQVRDLRLFRHKWLKEGWGSWQARDEFDRRVYAFEAGDPNRERLGWAFAIETQHAIELEELYVAPDVRGSGIGTELAILVAELAKIKGMPLRAWIGFADTHQESPGTIGALTKLANRMGVWFHPSPVRWAAYFASSEKRGSPSPIEPSSIPGRPKSTLGALTAFAMSVSATAMATTDEPGLAASTPAADAGPSLLSLDSPEWKELNAERAKLIYKKNREGLSPDERARYDWLQATVRHLVEAGRQRPPLVAPALQTLLDAKAAH